MCGLAGILGPGADDAHRLGAAMGLALAHRGPDAQGIWADAEAGVALVHRRLSILELSAAGAQPMHSADGRWVLAFNGEIYNHRALRAELEKSGGRHWRGHSDTEVLLEAIAQWGVKEALQRCTGMFALAAWDRQTRILTLARDRLGEKPLYVGRVGGDIVFGSELRAFRQHPAWRHDVEPAALTWMLEVGYVPAPWSIHPGIFKLPAASMLQLRPAQAWSKDVGGFCQQLQPYWQLDSEIEQARQSPWTGSESEALETLQSLLDDAVCAQMDADVPVAALLSGGIDSSLIVASMVKQAPGKVHAFTVGFDEPTLDETSAATATAQFLGVHHTVLPLQSNTALDLVESLPEVYDEPFADAAQLPALMVCHAAKGIAGVVLTGDGGDELFHGYQRYLDAARLWPWMTRTPARLRGWICRRAETLAECLPPGRLGRALIRQSTRLTSGDVPSYAMSLLRFPSMRTKAATLFLQDPAWPRLPACLLQAPIGEQLRYFDQAFTLPEGIHTKLDRASMRAGLELRVPMLDLRLLSFSWQLPLHWLANKDQGKCLLRKLAASQLPPATAHRRKHGFDVPVSQWLRGPLKKWSASLLAPHALENEPHLDAKRIQVLFKAHQSGKADYGYALWAVLMFRLWSLRYG
ncbi:asparagine synthase (glutamine-hydrolyzing) [Vandammella animalimorsus]|uniref:asparagine synthase (glutamine-hydrolyzing) n=1 Tax=Vandammella animalimorsus TaxID=2029117 RepID=A0A2A2T4Y6_9BURK|nr:asparagine synthase (glutamine-hydrolyzing) [Vandammella animalimorsus]PAT32255.1 asparagine synthase (glutamine-hydrolyzing) [Vandammella animalimorsus]PAX16620.1 asparagine synthase (glutamine-hydrolyzing) [Vandammella animalimorsus]PAX19250.1 asparagine synthase (glutamine-hydrolyzing) [Vandammella animalimorsus]